MVTKADIEHLAALARIRVTEEESAALQEDFASILAYVSEIADVSADVPEKETGEHYNVLREDGEPHERGVYTDALLAESPQREGDYIKVKKVL